MNIVWKRMCLAVLVVLLLMTTGCVSMQDGFNSFVDNLPEQEVDEPPEDEEDTHPFANDAKEFKKEMESLINVSLYEIDEDDETITYELKDAIRYNLDYKVTLEDGTLLQLPVSYDVLVKLGWTTRSDPDMQIDNEVQRGIVFTNAEGKEITLWTTNVDAIGTKDEMNSCDLSDCVFYEIEFAPYTFEYDDLDDVIYTRDKKNAGFTVKKSVTADADIKAVFKAFGTPMDIEYVAVDDVVKIMYAEKVDMGYSYATFCFSGKYGYMTSFKYQYSIQDVK